MKCYSKITKDVLDESAHNKRRAARDEYVASRTKTPQQKPENAGEQRYAARDEFLKQRGKS